MFILFIFYYLFKRDKEVPTFAPITIKPTCCYTATVKQRHQFRSEMPIHTRWCWYYLVGLVLCWDNVNGGHNSSVCCKWLSWWWNDDVVLMMTQNDEVCVYDYIAVGGAGGSAIWVSKQTQQIYEWHELNNHMILSPISLWKQQKKRYSIAPFLFLNNLNCHVALSSVFCCDILFSPVVLLCSLSGRVCGFNVAVIPKYHMVNFI